MTKIYRAIGLMSGTSMDGIDLALIESDGKKIINRLNSDYKSYEKSFKARLKSLIYNDPKLSEVKIIENELSILHANLVNEFLDKNKIAASSIDLIGFHGHTILHLPQQKITWQIGNPHLLAYKTKIKVVADFRNRDLVLGGQGAPLVPIYHFHLFKDGADPVATLNIGGISNITYFAGNQESDVEAFDVCFGNAPSDDLVRQKLNFDFDQDGKLAKSGNIDFILADRILQNDIFHKKPPKSFDRDDFSLLLSPINSLKIEDALATFAYMHARAIQINLDFLSNRPKKIFICGGGRKNNALMDEMKKWLSGTEVKAVEEVGFNGDTIEAEAFAFLGIRSLIGLPISFQKTTGVGEKEFEENSEIKSQKTTEVLPENNFALASLPQRSFFCGGVFYHA
ncbi:MAG: anhydro-N-acetylmuramic acid kinase [Rickettsiales bacterium]|nr:anhydro-N-acetylmuramic acid kinase [Rickettsiales bacterium]